MKANLAITPRNLGSLRLPGYCPRCMKYILNLKFHAPFDHFGAAIFGDAQKSQEAVLGYFIERDGCLPKEFSPFCDCTARANFPRHWSTFSYVHDSGVTLYGAPDEIFERKDGTLCVVDLKTAHCKGNKDPFHKQYECQVVGYAAIAEGLGLGEVTLGGLMYWEAQVGEVQEDPGGHYKGGKLCIPFTPKTVEIKIDYKILDPAIKEFKRVWNAKILPEGRPGCDDCKKLDLLFAIDEEFQLHDRQIFDAIQDSPRHRHALISSDFDRRQRRRNALIDIARLGDDMFSHDGLVANWEFVQYAEPDSVTALNNQVSRAE